MTKVQHNCTNVDSYLKPNSCVKIGSGKIGCYCNSVTPEDNLESEPSEFH